MYPKWLKIHLTLACFFLVLMPTFPGFFSKTSHGPALNRQYIKELRSEIKELQHKYAKLQPRRPYLIVNTTANQVSLVKNNSLILEAKCSSGSYILLRAEGGQRQWLFKTPRGRFHVTVKLRNPWWYKPDWAFIEEQQPIPPLSSPKRYQPDVLGDYAVAFGHGYLVHGTLYKRLLGLPVTHGCVRLDDEDMRLVFHTLTHGSKVFVF